MSLFTATAASPFNTAERIYLYKLFNLHDTEKRGFIGLPGLMSIMQHLYIQMVEEDLLASLEAAGCSLQQFIGGERPTTDIQLDFEGLLKWLSGGFKEDPFAVLRIKIAARGHRPPRSEHIACFKEVFDYADSGKRGTIDASGVAIALALMGQELAPEEVGSRSSFKFDDFVFFMCQRYGRSFKRELEEAFCCRDSKQSGSLEAAEVADILRETSGGLLTEREVEDIIQTVAVDGCVRYMEWAALWDSIK